MLHSCFHPLLLTVTHIPLMSQFTERSAIKHTLQRKHMTVPLKTPTCAWQLCGLCHGLNRNLPGTSSPFLIYYSFLEPLCRILECDSCTVSDTNLPSLSLSHRSSLLKGISGDSYSLGTIPSTDDSKKLKSGNHIRVLFESLCIRAWLLASVW
jgi:hypothetical protein